MDVQFDDRKVVVPTLAHASVWERESDPVYLRGVLRRQIEEVASLNYRLGLDGPAAKRRRQEARRALLVNRAIPRIVKLLGDDLPPDLAAQLPSPSTDE